MATEIKKEDTTETLTPDLYSRVVKDDEISDEELEIQAQENKENKPATPEEESETAKLGAEETTYKKRYGDLKTHYDKTLSDHKDREDKLKRQLEVASSKYVPPKSDEELEAWEKEYPDLYGIVKTLARKQATEQQSDLDKRVAKVEEREGNLRSERASMLIRKAHPDYDDLRENDDFHEWALLQPKQIQNWIYENSGDASLAIRAIDLYKRDKGIDRKPSKDKTEAKAKAAEDVLPTKTREDGKEPKIWRESEIGALMPHEFEEHEAEIDKAHREGRVLIGE